MSKVLILGDIHFGKNLSQGKVGVGSNLNSRIVDQLAILDWTLDQAIDNSVSDIIVTGDCFEEPKPNSSIITLFLSWLKKCQINSVKVHIILGNHDILRTGFTYSSPLDIISEIEMDGIEIYKNITTITINDTGITLIPFRDRKSFGVSSNAVALTHLKDILMYELASIPKACKKVVVGHLAIEGSIFVGDEIDDISNELFCTTEMFQGYDYVWMGHVHKPQVMNRNNPYVAHIGSMDISNFGETDHKKIIIIYDTEKNDFTSTPIPTRALKKILISVPKNVEDTTEYIINQIDSISNLDKSIVRVEIALESTVKSASKSTIEKYLITKGVFNVSGISESKKIALIKKDNVNSLDTKMDVLSAIKKYSESYIDSEIKEEFLNLAMEIYNSYKLEAK